MRIPCLVFEVSVVTCYGNVSSPNIDLTDFPFVFRGIALIGIDS